MATKKTGSSKKSTTMKKVGKAVTGAAKSVASALGMGKKKTTKKKSGTAKKKTASKSTARRK